MKKSILLGLLASFFFAATFVMNRSMNVSGGSYLWSASLRYFFMLPILYIILKGKKETEAVYQMINKQKTPWFVWSTVGFGLFYLPLTFASDFGPSWMVAGTWQLTIVAGIILTPLFGKKIPIKALLISCLILIGAVLLHLGDISGIDFKGIIICTVSILVAAFAYPLGNRKMLEICDQHLTTLQRVYGMTLCSIPFWLVVASIALVKVGLPSGSQIVQSLIVALFSGVIATVLFFHATHLVHHNEKQLAAVEATQAGEIVFTVLGSALFLSDPFPSLIGWIGIMVIICGIVWNSYVSR